MAERRRVTLLDCAIAASAAIVPVLLGVIALVAWVRPGDPDGLAQSGRSDRYVSVRHVAALQTFERAVVRRGAPGALRVGADEVLDGIGACRQEWNGDAGVTAELRRIALGGAPEPSAAARIAEQLSALDAALLRFSSRPNGRVEQRLGLDADRWFAAARDSLATPLHSADAPGRRFRLRCADLVGALAAVRRADAAMLETFAWRGSEGAATLARWRPEQQVAITAREVTRRNPWGGIAGCVYLGGGEGEAPSHFVAAGRSAQQRVCAAPEVVADARAPGAAPTPLRGEPGPGDAVDDPRWSVPPSLLALLQPLDTLRQPGGALYRQFAAAEPGAESDSASSLLARADAPASRNRVRLDGAAVDLGFSIDLTIDPALQALAQKTAACYTGRHDVCRGLDIRRREDADGPLGQRLLEGAMVRMAAVAVVDVASGRIEALAGALSPCARQEVDGPGRDAGCDARLPYRAQYRADALLNPAVHHDAMPASTIKPILAAAFLADGQGRGARLLAAERAAMHKGGPPTRDSLRGQLMRSDSARFLDRMFCIEQGFADCARPWEVQAAARAFGWNAGCAEADASCGRADLLFGRPLGGDDAGASLAPGPTAIAYGRLLNEPVGRRAGAPMASMPATVLDAGILRRCAAGLDGRRLSDDDWEKCRGGAVVDVVAEGWGQGHARASVVGVAGMMTTLAAAANGEARVTRPHLVAGLHGVAATAPDPVAAAAARWRSAATVPQALSREAAEVILSGLSFSHRAGTARTACEQVFDAGRCREIGWLAGKTGTPSFPSDGLSLDELVRLCRDGAPPSPESKRGACSSLRPYKWYVAAWRADRAGDGPWTKAIAVLAERNWVRASGRIHGTGDHGPNPAAEIAMQIVGRATGALDAPPAAGRAAVAQAGSGAPAVEARR